jgi:hypothetical protein
MVDLRAIFSLNIEGARLFLRISEQKGALFELRAPSKAGAMSWYTDLNRVREEIRAGVKAETKGVSATLKGTGARARAECLQYSS